jgi:hypothetical protein
MEKEICFLKKNLEKIEDELTQSLINVENERTKKELSESKARMLSSELVNKSKELNE